MAWWDADARKVTCAECREVVAVAPEVQDPIRPVDVVVETEPSPVSSSDADEEPDFGLGHPGASAAREYERRRAAREAAVRKAHPRIGGMLLWLQDPPQHETAFKSGARGEVAVGESLNRRTAEGPAVILHDRRMPHAAGNIDHIAIAPTGVFVIDAKAHSGKVRIETPLLGKAKLKIAGRDQTKLIDGLDRQVAVVRSALERIGHKDTRVQGVLCFTTADLPLIGGTRMRGHLLLRRRALAKRLNADGPLQPAEIDRVARSLAWQLPAA